jgi:hypothetical protein
VAASPPGYRLDDYAQAILGKLAVSLEIAREHNFLPLILGDLFHLPRNSPNSLLVALIELFRPNHPFVLVGNHDKHEARLTRDVSLAVIEAAQVIRLIDRAGPVCSLLVAGSRVLLGASPDWTPLPRQVDPEGHDLVIWLATTTWAFQAMTPPGCLSRKFSGWTWWSTGTCIPRDRPGSAAARPGSTPAASPA